MAQVDENEAVPRARPAGKHRVVIIGGGFGGLNAAQSLKHVDVEVVLIDRRNFHLFQPLLYQVATGALSPANIAAPLRGVLHRQKNCEVLLSEVIGFDLPNKRVLLADNGELYYDSLIVGAGSSHSYFGHNEWAKLAPGLKSIEDATEIRRRVLFAFEHAEWETDPKLREAWMRFVVVGGGPTGVELAGALSEVSRQTLRYDFRHINPRDTHVMLVDNSDRVLSAYPPDLSARAQKDLERLKVDVRNHTLVTSVDEGSVTVKSHDREEQIATWTVLWAAGVQASPLGQELAKSSQGELDRAGRIKVMPDCTLPNFPDVFPIGDMANCPGSEGKPLPGVAQVAIQQGRFAAKVIAARIRGDKPPAAFHYKDLGMMATIGRRKAIAVAGKMKFTGVIAWYMWLFVHLMALVQFQSRLLVLMQWGWSYLTFARTARLITGKTLAVKTRLAPTGNAASIGDPHIGDTRHGGGAIAEPVALPTHVSSPPPIAAAGK